LAIKKRREKKTKSVVLLKKKRDCIAEFKRKIRPFNEKGIPGQGNAFSWRTTVLSGGGKRGGDGPLEVMVEKATCTTGGPVGYS